MNINTIPRDLRTVIDDEQVDFVVKSERNYPKKRGLSLILFSFFWNTFVIIILSGFIVPLFKKGKVNFTSNGAAKVASFDDMDSLLFPSLFLGFFLLIGIATLIWGLVLLFQKGGYFVGTETRFIKYRKGTTEIKDWEQFSGNIQIKNKGQYGNIELELRTGKMQSRKNSASKFVPDMIYISRIKNVFDIEKKCRIRIQENDPTPRVSKDTRY